MWSRHYRCWLTWVALAGVAGSTGCASTPPVEKFVSTMVEEVVGPAVRKGLEQGVRHLGVQAGAQAVNPTYVVEFEGKWVVGIEGRATVGVEGVSGQIQVSTDSDKATTGATNAGATRTPPLDDGLQHRKQPVDSSAGSTTGVN